METINYKDKKEFEKEIKESCKIGRPIDPYVDKEKER